MFSFCQAHWHCLSLHGLFNSLIITDGNHWKNPNADSCHGSNEFWK